MYSVFSNKLIEYVTLVEKVRAKTARIRTVPRTFETINEAFDDFIKRPNPYFPEILLDRRSYQGGATCYESYKLSTCVGLQNVIKWICKEILVKLPTDPYKTRNVKIRIATGMLNNLERDGLIDHNLNIYYHDTFLLNIHGLMTDLVKAELPFQTTRGCYPHR